MHIAPTLWPEFVESQGTGSSLQENNEGMRKRRKRNFFIFLGVYVIFSVNPLKIKKVSSIFLASFDVGL